MQTHEPSPSPKGFVYSYTASPVSGPATNANVSECPQTLPTIDPERFDGGASEYGAATHISSPSMLKNLFVSKSFLPPKRAQSCHADMGGSGNLNIIHRPRLNHDPMGSAISSSRCSPGCLIRPVSRWPQFELEKSCRNPSSQRMERRNCAYPHVISLPRRIVR